MKAANTVSQRARTIALERNREQMRTVSNSFEFGAVQKLETRNGKNMPNLKSMQISCKLNLRNAPRLPGGSVRGARANLTRLVFRCIEAKFCKKVLVGQLSPRSTQCTPLHRYHQSSIFCSKLAEKNCMSLARERFST